MLLLALRRKARVDLAGVDRLAAVIGWLLYRRGVRESALGNGSG